MKKFNIIVIVAMIIIATVLLLAQCTEQKGGTIEGRVIEYENCTYDNKGYLIEVQNPRGIGKDVFLCGTQYSNVVKTYSQPINTLQIGDQVIGKWHFLKDSSCRVCTDEDQVYNVPEIVISFQK